MAVCESLAPYVSNVMLELACNSEPVVSVNISSHLSPCLRWHA